MVHVLIPQDRSRADRKLNQKHRNTSSTAESEYDVVDDHEEMLNVHILPSRPIYDEKEYAGREAVTTFLLYSHSHTDLRLKIVTAFNM